MLAEGPGTQASEGSPEGSPSPIPAIAATHLAWRGHQGLWRGFVGRSGSPSKHGPNPCPCPGPALQVRIRGRPLAPSTLISGLTAVSLGAVSLPRLLMPVADLQLGVLLCGAEGRASGGWHGGDLEGPQNSFFLFWPTHRLCLLTAGQSCPFYHSSQGTDPQSLCSQPPIHCSHNPPSHEGSSSSFEAPAACPSPRHSRQYHSRMALAIFSVIRMQSP